MPLLWVAWGLKAKKFRIFFFKSYFLNFFHGQRWSLQLVTQKPRFKKSCAYGGGSFTASRRHGLHSGGLVCIVEAWSSQQAWEARVCIAEDRVCIAEARVCIAEACVCIAEAHGVQGLPPSSSMMTQDGISALFMNAMNRVIVFLMDMNKLKLLYTAVQLVFYTNISIHGVWNRREIQLTWPALPYDYACFADGTPFV